MMKSKKMNWEAVVLGCVAMLAAVLVPAAQGAFADAVEPEGKIVEIAPTGNNDLPTLRGDVLVEQQAVEPADDAAPFWIGIRGRNVDEPVLRTQFQLAGDMGVVIEEVVKDSPAAEAGLRKHDILLRANGEALSSMEQLSDLVASGEGKPIELLLLRLAKEETIAVVPQKMPADMVAARQRLGTGFGGGDIFGGLLQGDEDIIRMFPRGGFGMNGFGLNGQWQMNNNLPNGYSVSITRQNDEPAQITVKKGDQTWTITGDDEKSLDELPEDVRDQVKAMLQNPAMNFNFGNMQNWGKNFQMQIPHGIVNPEDVLNFGNEQRDKVLERMEKLEQRLKDLQQQLEQSEQH